MIHPLRALLLVPAIGLLLPATRAAGAAADQTRPLKGEHVIVHFRPDDWKLLHDQREFIGFLDEVYLAMAELTAHRPPMQLRGYRDLGAWGTAGIDGINIDWSCVAGVLSDFNDGKIEFGVVHEMGHVFDARDFARWYITPVCGGETFANIKLSYALERLLPEASRYRIEFGPGGRQTGRGFGDNFYLDSGAGYLAGDKPWEQMAVDDLHSFHLRLVRRLGWDVYKKWFRAYYLVEAQPDGRAPPSCDDPLRINLVCALLSMFSGEDLVADFQQWRMPVTEKSVLEVARRYDLERVVAATDRQFAEEHAAGKIHLDPLSLRVRLAATGDGATTASIFCILGNAPGVTVRYTLDGTAVDSSSPVDPGSPIPLSPGATLKAAMFTAGRPQPLLTTATTIGPS